MTQTYAQIQKQIERLQKAADALREKEVAGVVARIKVAITHYGLTAGQLGFGVAKVAKSAGKIKQRGKAAPSAKYSDGNGQSWTGRGPRPRWLREAIASGASLASFLAVPGAGSGGSAAPAKAQKSKRSPSTVHYQDGAGNSWTGRGPRPRWLKEAIAAGRTLEELKS